MSETTSADGRDLHGWLVINAFMNSDKFNELVQWFLISAGRLNIVFKVFTNAELAVGLPVIEKPDFVLFWDKDVLLASYLEALGIPVFNSAKSIALCDDKGKTYLALKDSGIKMPKTILAPFTYDTVGYTELSFLERVGEELGFPLVVKENYGSFGMQVYLVKNLDELKEKVKEISPKPCLFQEYFGEYAGSDLRLQVVGESVVACMLRYSETGDFRANITLGGKMEKYVPGHEQVEMALKAAKTLGLDFAGVDLLFGHYEEPVLCEVNSNAHFKTIFDCTHVDVSYEIMKYIKNKIMKAEEKSEENK